MSDHQYPDDYELIDLIADEFGEENIEVTVEIQLPPQTQ